MQAVPEKRKINFSGLICGVTGQNQVLVTNCHLPQNLFKSFYRKNILKNK